MGVGRKILGPRNKVVRIRNNDGVWLEKDGDTGDCFKSFFADLFSSSRPRDCLLLSVL